MLLTLRHGGATTFSDLSVRLEPRRGRAGGQKGLPSELRSRPAGAGGGGADAGGDRRRRGGRGSGRAGRDEAAHPNPSSGGSGGPAGLPLPRTARLASDQVIVYRGKGREAVALTPREGAYPVHSGEVYQIVVCPRIPGVSQLKLRNVPERTVLLSEQHDVQAGSWTFLIEVTANNLFSRGERIYYDAESASGQSTGEIHLLIRPPRLHTSSSRPRQAPPSPCAVSSAFTRCWAMPAPPSSVFLPGRFSPGTVMSTLPLS